MYYTIVQRQLWLLLLGVFMQIIYTDAKILLTSSNGTTLNLHTYDYFLYREPFYRYKGIGAVWGVLPNSDGDGCTFQPLNSTSSNAKNLTAKLTAPASLAIVVEMYSLYSSGCQTRAKAQTALDALSRQLEQNGLPSVKLLVLINVPDIYQPKWESNFIGQNSVGLSGAASGSSFTAITLMPVDETISFATIVRKRYEFFYLTAEEEQGPWNAAFLSPGLTACKWIYFTIVLLVFTYAIVRSIALVKLKKLPKDLLLVAFIASIAYVFVLFVHIIVPPTAFSLNMIGIICNFLSNVPFDLILIHWSIHGKTYFSRFAVICFRVVISLNMALIVMAFVFQVYIYSDDDWILKDVKKYVALNSITNAIPLINAIIFGGFTIWFIFCFLKLRKHAEARFRFIQLTLFTALACFTFVVFGLYFILTDLKQPVTTINGLVSFSILYDLAYFIRALVFLSVLGVRWPKSKDSIHIHAPLEEMSVAEVGSITNKHRDRLELD
ncbi:hypothetical protein BDF19DRAFT_433412 [Syncephalis fuscata]|nr:hypothetical protein BDF19DRAFT_433412 [Syncephalis fuscata]